MSGGFGLHALCFAPSAVSRCQTVHDTSPSMHARGRGVSLRRHARADKRRSSWTEQQYYAFTRRFLMQKQHDNLIIISIITQMRGVFLNYIRYVFSWGLFGCVKLSSQGGAALFSLPYLVWLSLKRPSSEIFQPPPHHTALRSHTSHTFARWTCKT